MNCVNPFHLPDRLVVPCGRCMACRIARTSEWTTRIMHELEGKDGCFLTLTYNDENLPVGGTLVKRDLQLFMKRLRRYLEPLKIKYYACGEYGDETERPHYHAIIMGWKPDIKDCYKPNRKTFVSKEIERLWLAGNNVVGSPDRSAIGYVVGYIRKKIVGSASESAYMGRLQPFALQSAGIGLSWAQKNEKKIKRGGITRDGVNVGVPRYYQKKLFPKGSYHDEKRAIVAVVDEMNMKNRYENAGKDYMDLREDKLSDQERRRKHLEAKENLIKKRTNIA